jgi:hypothetical protein
LDWLWCQSFPFDWLFEIKIVRRTQARQAEKLSGGSSSS